jgi:hypothetical protein
MNWLFKLNNFFRIWGGTFRAMGRIKIWLPLIILFAFQIVLLYKLVNFHYPPWGIVLVPLLKALLPERVLHYPQYYLALPFIYNLTNLVVVGLLSIFTNSMVIWLVTSRYLDNKLSLKGAFSRAVNRFGHLFLIWLINTALVAAILILPAFLLSGWIEGSPRRLMFIQTVSFVAGVLISGLFAYCFNLILISNISWLKSVKRNFEIFRRNFFSTCFFIGIPGLISWGYGLVVSNTPLLMSKFRPETIPLLLGLGSLLNLLVIFWILGSLARLFLLETKEA